MLITPCAALLAFLFSCSFQLGRACAFMWRAEHDQISVCVCVVAADRSGSPAEALRGSAVRR